MRVRRLSATGDYTFGQSQSNFLVNDPLGVGQNVKTRLKLFTGEWFLDKSSGTPWRQQVLGVRSNPTYDMVIQSRIATTFGVEKILAYTSVLSAVSPGLSSQRRLTVRATILTIYSEQPIEVEAQI